MIQIKTKDADEAAFFWTQPLVEFQNCEIRSDYNRKALWFVFDVQMSDEEFQKLRNDFRNGKTLVEPKAFIAKRNEVKNLIRENIYS